MKIIIIISIIMVIVMFLFIFIMFKNIVKKINANSKKYFLDSIQEYNYMVFEKSKELEDFQNRIKSCKEKQNQYLDDVRKQLEDKEKLREIEMKKIDNDISIEGLPKVTIAEYREENFFHNYKELQKNFNINGEKIVREFIKEHKYEENIKSFESLVSFKRKFTQEVIYEILSLDVETQLQFLNSIANATVKKVLELEKYSKDDFKFLKLLEEIDKKIEIMDPTVYVYVGNVNYNYDYIDENIKTLIFKNMVEGIIIKYQNKMYDYSI